MKSAAYAACFAVLAVGCQHGPASDSSSAGRAWLAGDHHIHSQYSADWQPNPADASAPPAPVLGADGRYTIIVNALMAQRHGLAWMVSTDHGGPNHSKLNYDQAYPELLQAREQAPGVVQFYGMEFDTPGADHSSLIIPRTPGEREALREIESRFSKREAWPEDKLRDAEPKMLEALAFMRQTAPPPIVIANHPSRSATTPGGYGQDTPAELRAWNNTAPNVAVGMEGAPGHQASALNPDGSLDPKGARGGYGRAPTMGGFDAMTARVGGFWDSMLGEGRRWWITSTSDSHRHYTEGGSDFWPGEYAKTYVLARKDPADILDALRNGRIFVTTGDLVSQVDIVASSGGKTATIGSELVVRQGADVTLQLRVRDPAGANHKGQKPALARIDLIVGDVSGPLADASIDANPTTRVERRFLPSDWKQDGEIISLTYTLRDMRKGSYVRVRGTNGAELDPAADPAGEDPWSDLWFYTNPIFLKVG